LRAPDERLATLPDFFVADVRLDAAAARFVVFLAAVLRAVAFVAPRPELRAEDLRAVVERAEEVRAEDLRAAVFLAEDFAGLFFAVLFLAEDFAEVFLAAVFFAVVFLAEDFAEDFAADLAEVFLAAVFLAVVVLAAVFVPAFFVLLRAEEVPAFLALVLEPFLAPVFLVLVAPVSPVNNAVSGFLLSVGIAASFKGLRVQPSRLQGNVVIPSEFRLTESVESRTRTFSVDTLARRAS
jgi:hypothetical protein